MVKGIDYSPSELLNLGREVAINEPEILEKYKYTVEKPAPVITHIIYLYPLRSHFCEKLSVSLQELIERTDLRKKFIAVAIKLFNPEYITGYKNELNDGFAEELSELLQCDRTWISQQVKDIKAIYNPKAKNDRQKQLLLNSYQSDRVEYERLCNSLNESIQQENSRIKRKEPGKAAVMFG